MSDKEHPKRIESLTKRQLEDFNIAEARGWIIDSFQEIEYRINSKIVDFFKPTEEATFKKVVLNSSILDIGSKLKILWNIGIRDKNLVDNIRKLAAIRNGFAHVSISEQVNISIDDGKEDGIDSISLVVESIIKVMNSNGEIKPKIAFDYLVEFSNLYEKIREGLKYN